MNTDALCRYMTRFKGLRFDFMIAQFVHNEWIESYDPTIEDSYRTQVAVDVSILMDYANRIT